VKPVRVYFVCKSLKHLRIDFRKKKQSCLSLTLHGLSLIEMWCYPYICLEEFDKNAKVAIAEELIEYKNDFWPEYDENDEHLNWEAVDAGEYDITKETFEKSITLMDIVMRENDIYCEYNDGDLFGGHRIHASFDYEHNLLDAEI